MGGCAQSHMKQILYILLFSLPLQNRNTDTDHQYLKKMFYVLECKSGCRTHEYNVCDMHVKVFLGKLTSVKNKRGWKLNRKTQGNAMKLQYWHFGSWKILNQFIVINWQNFPKEKNPLIFEVSQNHHNNKWHTDFPECLTIEIPF